MANPIESTSPKPTRRDFVLAGTTMTAAGLSTLTVQDLLAAEGAPAKKPIIQDGDTILFQGDSITDVGRKARQGRRAQFVRRNGRRLRLARRGELLIDRPTANLKIFNRDASGNKVYQMAERWQEDCLDLKPNVLSILIGVNDFWHKHKHGYDGTLEKYETDYRALVKRTKDALPEVKLIICEPFVLKCGDVDDTWFPEFDGYCDAAKQIADDAGAMFVPFQTMFDAAAKLAPAEKWAADGVHPTHGGDALMAHSWLKAAGM